MTSPTLRDLFEAGLEIEPAARAAWLMACCADPEVRAQLGRMLDSDAADRGPDTGLAGDLAQALAPRATRWREGMQVGAFRLLEALGEGGHATVFRAYRESAGVRQHVALKLLHRSLHSPETHRQFQRERHALSQLQHPSIARLIEGGVTEDGLAYIALELVEGVTITEHARQRRLGLRPRLQLFVQVCRAVEAAHRALIVHRDLKPANVLVTPAGEVKLLDFGIAKLLQADEDETRTQVPAFTPAYAAPEQRADGAITTATDVYALGVLLGELLTGQRLGKDDPRLPSSCVPDESDPGYLPSPPATTRRQLRGDLDNIVRKSLAAEPLQRYASAGSFADDIERLLLQQPVAAHPPSRWYRARKFIARHRGGLAASAVFVLALLGSSAIALRQAALAQQETQRANAMRDFMVDAFREAEPASPRDGAPRITAVVEAAIARARADAEMLPAVRSELLNTLGAVQREQGQLPAALDTLAWNRERARQALGARHPLTIQAGIELLRARSLALDRDPARALADELLAQIPADQHRALSQTLTASSSLAAIERDFALATDHARRAVTLARGLDDEDLLAEALSGLSQAQFVAGDLAAAAASSEEHLALRQRRFGPKHVRVAASHANLSRIHRRAGDREAAERHILAALAIDAAVLPPDDWRRALHLNALSALRREQRDFLAAIEATREGLRINRASQGDTHPHVLNDLNNLGSLWLLMEDPGAAVEPLREAVAGYVARLGPQHHQTAAARANLGMALAYAGDVAEGETELRAAIDALSGAARAEPGMLALACEKLARVRLDLGLDDVETPLDCIDSALASLPATEPYWHGRADTLRAESAMAAGDDAAAVARLQRARAALDASRQADPMLAVEVMLRQATLARLHGDTADATARASEASHALKGLPHPPARLQRLAAALATGATARPH